MKDIPNYIKNRLETSLLIVEQFEPVVGKTNLIAFAIIFAGLLISEMNHAD